MTFLFSITFFIVGFFLRPLVSNWVKSYFNDYFESKYHRFEIEFKIEFYNQPSIHHLGQEGILVKSEPVKVQIDAPDEEEALNLLDGVIKQEVKAELLSIKEVPKL